MKPMRFMVVLLVLLLLTASIFALKGDSILALEEKVAEAKKQLKGLDYKSLEQLLEKLRREGLDDDTVHRIDALLIESLPVETRAIWLDSVSMNELTTKEKIVELMDLLREININLILADVFGNGHSVFPSELIEQRDAFKYLTDGDVVPILIDEAHKRGIEIHGLASLFGVDSYGITPFMDRFEWLDRTLDGGYLTGITDFEAFLSPAIPEVREFMLEAIKEVASYDFDGIHLDYIRYGRNVGYHPSALEQYSDIGGDPTNLSDPTEWNKYLRFRTSFITSFVDEARTEVLKLKPHLIFSAAVGSPLAHAQREIAQDWLEWAEKRLLHLIFHMGYVETSVQYQTVIDKDVTPIGNLAISYPGIGVYAVSENELQNQIIVGQNNPVSGQALFSTIHLTPEKAAILKNGVYREPAIPTFRDPKGASKEVLGDLSRRLRELGPQIGIEKETLEVLVDDLKELQADIGNCTLRPFDDRDLQEGSKEEYEMLKEILTKFSRLKRPVSKLPAPTRERALSDLVKAERLIRALFHLSKPIN